MGFIRSETQDSESIATPVLRDDDEPSAINWVEKGCVQSVKDQGNCGSCYSFAATGAIESAHCALTSELLDLSEKDCLDCSFRFNRGCKGGHMEGCYEYFSQSKKLCYEDQYQYKPKYQVCKEEECTLGHILYEPVLSYHKIEKKDIYGLMAALDKNPVSLAVQADSSMFMNYKTESCLILNLSPVGSK